MKFSEILAISGQPGLFKYLAQGKGGIIIESLTDGRRSQVSSSSRVSTLTDIAIYTEGEDKPLSEVFQNMCEMLNGEAALSHKSNPDELTAAFELYLPEYDKYRVRLSDIKKVFQWYNVLQAAGMREFVEAEEEANEEETLTEE